jgi:uncharacterized phosphosugar-binding protein
MTDIADRYFAGVIDRLQEVRATEGPAIDRAAEACAESIAADKLVFSFGTGYGSLPALEMFPRTGTIVGFRPIVESTMISFHKCGATWVPVNTDLSMRLKATARRSLDLINWTRPTRWCSFRTPG